MNGPVGGYRYGLDIDSASSKDVNSGQGLNLFEAVGEK